MDMIVGIPVRPIIKNIGKEKENGIFSMIMRLPIDLKLAVGR